MRIKDLLSEWTKTPAHQLTARKYSVRLPVWDAARIAALADLFPSRTKTQIITDLISAAVDEIETAIPYVKGEKVISEDDYGDPIYEDTGLSPRFRKLTREYANKLREEAEAARKARRSSVATAVK